MADNLVSETPEQRHDDAILRWSERFMYLILGSLPVGFIFVIVAIATR